MDEPEFLKKVNLTALQKETGKTLAELAALVGIGEKVIYKWNYDKSRYGSRPSYNALVRLIEAGATVETLFGTEYKAAMKTIEKAASEDQVMEAVKKALKDLIQK